MGRFRLLSLLITSLLCGFGVQAEEAGDPAAKKTMTAEQILADPYFRAFLQIGLEKEQMPQFKKLIDEYAYQRGKAIDKEKRRYSGDLEDVIKRAHRKISKRFVKKVDSLLNDDQFSRFAGFHEVLDERLKKHEGLDENLEASEMF